MFINKIKVVFFAAFVMLGVVVAANAQIENGGAIKFDLSHSFVINNKTFPAGKYSITVVGMPDGSSDLYKIQSENGKESAFFSTIGKLYGEPSKKTELLFKQAGDTYYLAEIRTKGDDTAAEVEKTKTEKLALAAAAVE